MNEAGEAVLNLKKQWTTDRTPIPPHTIIQNGCTFQLRAFHGRHNFKVELPSGKKVEKEIEVTKNNIPLLVDIMAHEGSDLI